MLSHHKATKDTKIVWAFVTFVAPKGYPVVQICPAEVTLEYERGSARKSASRRQRQHDPKSAAAPLD
jgi:hypothetical protein